MIPQTVLWCVIDFPLISTFAGAGLSRAEEIPASRSLPDLTTLVDSTCFWGGAESESGCVRSRQTPECEHGANGAS